MELRTEESIQEKVYAYLRKQILELILVPGAVISTQDMAARLQVSRTPVREALIRLQREGMVKMLPQKETVVSRIDLERVRQERFMRRSLETEAVRAFIRVMRFEDLECLNDWMRRMLEASAGRSYEEFVACDDGFHQVFFERSGQGLSWCTIEEICTHYRRIRLLTLQGAENMERAMTQHIELLQAVEQRREEAIGRMVEEHLICLDGREEQLRKAYASYIL